MLCCFFVSVSNIPLGIFWYLFHAWTSFRYFSVLVWKRFTNKSKYIIIGIIHCNNAIIRDSHLIYFIFLKKEVILYKNIFYILPSIPFQICMWIWPYGRVTSGKLPDITVECAEKCLFLTLKCAKPLHYFTKINNEKHYNNVTWDGWANKKSKSIW